MLGERADMQMELSPLSLLLRLGEEDVLMLLFSPHSLSISKEPSLYSAMRSISISEGISLVNRCVMRV